MNLLLTTLWISYVAYQSLEENTSYMSELVKRGNGIPQISSRVARMTNWPIRVWQFEATKVSFVVARLLPQRFDCM